MESPFPTDEASVRHRFDRLCQMSLRGEAINYYKHMDNRRKHEITFSELSDDELRKLSTVDKYFYAEVSEAKKKESMDSLSNKLMLF